MTPVASSATNATRYKPLRRASAARRRLRPRRDDREHASNNGVDRRMVGGLSRRITTSPAKAVDSASQLRLGRGLSRRSPRRAQWITRPHEPGEPARHVAEFSDRAGFAHTRANVWRYEPGAKGRRHRHPFQEETFVVLAGRCRCTSASRRSVRMSHVGGLIHVEPGTPLQTVNHGDERSARLCLRHAARRRARRASRLGTPSCPRQDRVRSPSLHTRHTQSRWLRRDALRRRRDHRTPQAGQIGALSSSMREVFLVESQ